MNISNINFSVLLSVYYKENPYYLQQAIDSVLNQTFPPSEIVIVKDGPLTKELEEILSQYSDNRLFSIYGYEKNKGLGYALNYGVNKCKYEIIARMDSDDICDSRRFEKEINALIEMKLDFVGSNTIEFIDSINNVISKRVMPEKQIDIIEYSKLRNPFIHPSIVTYKKVILESGNYQPNYLVEDYDLWVRILKKGYKTYNIQENLVFMRVSKDFYRRRGGIKYCKSIVKFKKKMYKEKYINWRQYIKTKYSTVIVSLMPGFIRSVVYKKYLRK